MGQFRRSKGQEVVQQEQGEEQGEQGEQFRRNKEQEADQPQQHLLAVIERCQGLCLKVDVDPAGDGVGDDEKRAGQVVCPRVGVDPTLEVPEEGRRGSDRDWSLIHTTVVYSIFSSV